MECRSHYTMVPESHFEQDLRAREEIDVAERGNTSVSSLKSPSTLVERLSTVWDSFLSFSEKSSFLEYSVPFPTDIY